MDKNNKRRQFLKKVIPTAIGGTIIAKAGMSADKKENQPMEDKPVNPILKVKPLGFQWETQDPFLFCVHHEDFFPKGTKEMGPPPEALAGRNIGSDFHIKDGWRMYHGKSIPGFPGHPHRGFETVTVVRKGWVDHSDSAGGAGRYGDGDVQWMTAGKGLQHSEMFPLIYEDKENTMELFQIWLNLPKKSKFVEPDYKMLWGTEIPNINHVDANNKKVLIEVIAGKVQGHKAPAPPKASWAAVEDNDVAIWNIRMDAGAQWDLPKAKEGTNRSVYFYSGDALHLNGKQLNSYHAADVLASEKITLKAGNENCNILVLQGKPINEPVVKHGPFVMNTREELQQAFADYQATEFGGWPWPKYEHVHDKSKGRFALYSNGKLEEKA